MSFGTVKALANLLAGGFSDRFGRKILLIAGWLFGLPVPFLVIFAPDWNWVIFANILLGINQGLCWSTTVIMKIDLVGPKQRGLAMGLNECSGYLAVSLTTLLTAYIAATSGLRPWPFYPGVAFALSGFLLSLLFVKETRPWAEKEAETTRVGPVSALQGKSHLSFGQVFLLTSWKEKTLFAASQAGMVNNLNDGLVWGLLPILLSAEHLSLSEIGITAAAYPGIWGIAQLATGALSDRIGRKWMISAGMWVQSAGIGLFITTHGFFPWLGGSILLGIGTALVYPTLLAAISDVANPEWRASAVGVYRLWRDGGYAVGALMAGLIADAINIEASFVFIGILTFISGIIVASVMRETLLAQTAQPPARRFPECFTE